MYQYSVCGSDNAKKTAVTQRCRRFNKEEVPVNQLARFRGYTPAPSSHKFNIFKARSEVLNVGTPRWVSSRDRGS